MQLEPTLLSCAEIVSRLREELPDLRARYGVEALSIFGSRVQGEARPESDVDVLVEFSRTPGFFGFIELEDELSAKLGVKVDLVMKTALRPRIGRRALAEAVPI